MFYILLFLSFSIVLGGNGYFCLTLLVLLSVETSHIIHLVDNTNIFC